MSTTKKIIFGIVAVGGALLLCSAVGVELISGFIN